MTPRIFITLKPLQTSASDHGRLEHRPHQIKSLAGALKEQEEQVMQKLGRSTNEHVERSRGARRRLRHEGI